MIRLEAASKRYWRPSPGRGLARWRRAEHWALRDISLEVERGETLGILGHNGAGKTTLLRILGGVTEPSAGQLRTVGRIAPLITVGVGFHPELSGRDNVVLNGMLLGLSGREVQASFDSIVSFSEVAEYIDTPVKFFSSGMLMRLAFAVAMHARPDVLLVDEVMTVGDIAFQRKCLERMKELRDRGTTIVLVSHSVHAIRLLCRRAIVLDHGQLMFDGSSVGAVATYHDLLSAAAGGVPLPGDALLTERRLVDDSGQSPHELVPGARYVLGYRMQLPSAVAEPAVTFVITHETGAIAYRHVVRLPSGLGGRSLDLEVGFTATLAGGTYRVGVVVTDGEVSLANDLDALVIFVPTRPGSYGVTELDASIEVDGERISDHGSFLSD